MGGLFGGGGDTETTTKVKLAPEQQRLLDLTTPVFENFVQQPPTLFPGSGIAPFDPLQLAGQQAGVGAAGQQTGLANQAAQQQAFLAGPALFPQTNPALQQATLGAVRPLVQAFEQSILPGIRGGAQAAGQFGGSRQGIAEGIAGQGLLQGIGDTSAALQNQAFQGGLEAFTRGLALQPQTAGLQTLPAQVLDAIGGQRQFQEQRGLDEQSSRFMQEQLIPLQIAQDIAQIAFGIPGGSTTSTAEQPSGTSAQNVLGLGALGATIFGNPLGGLAGLLGFS